MITTENLVFHEFIGLYAQTVDSDPYTGISGCIVRETKNMITFRSGKVLKNLPKNRVNLIVHLPTCGCFISGTSLIGRPEDRILRKNCR